MANKTLFDITQDLIDVIQLAKEGKIEVERANMVIAGTQTVVNSAKVMLEFTRITGAKESLFFKEIPQISEPGKIGRGCKLCRHFNLCDSDKMKCHKTTLEYFEPK